jgi:hypothetical protein
MTVLDALSTTPQTKHELAVALGWKTRTGAPDTRRVEEAVQTARLAGAPIASGSAGYWLAKDSADLVVTVDWLRGKALSSLRTYAALRRAYYRLQAEEAKPLAFFIDEDKAA